jgi:serine/threonine-protein kinase
MTTCNRKIGQQFLTGSLSGLEETAFIEHLDECVSCRRWLEESAGDEASWRSAREILSCSRETQGWTDTDFDATTNVEMVAKLSAPVVALLTPSDDPAMLGRLGTYEIVGVIGRGGMGIVLKGFDRVLNRNVAVKVLDPALADISAPRQRFAREARAMAAVSHEHVVPVFAVNERGTLPYFVMEYVPGGTLESRLTHEGQFDAVEIVRVGVQVAHALSAAHRQGLVHRDIKPSNILLDTGTERVRVADFGLARALNDATFTRSGLLAGTPQYMAPEQVRGESCDVQSDLFSLGSVMYAMCVGHPPFRAETVYAVMQRIVHDQPRSIREQNPQIPAWLEEFIVRLLAKDKSARFSTATEVVQVLEKELAFLQNPASTGEPLRGWRRPLSSRGAKAPPLKRRWIVAAVTSIATLILLTVAWVNRDALLTLDNDQQNQNETDQEARPRKLVLLWEADGMSAAKDMAENLEANWKAIDQPSNVDPWQQNVESIQQKLIELDSSNEMRWPDRP